MPSDGYGARMTIQRLLLILAIVLFVLLGFAGMGWLIEGHKDPMTALLGFGLASFAGAHLS